MGPLDMVREEGPGLVVVAREGGARVAEGVEGEEGEAAGGLQAEGAVLAGCPGVHILDQSGRDEVVVVLGEVHGLWRLQADGDVGHGGRSSGDL
jgi:hypothetical protein